MTPAGTEPVTTPAGTERDDAGRRRRAEMLTSNGTSGRHVFPAEPLTLGAALPAGATRRTDHDL